MNPGGPTQRDLREGWGAGVQRSVAVAGRRHRDDQVMVMVMDVEGSAKRDVREDWRAKVASWRIVEHHQGEEKKKRSNMKKQANKTADTSFLFAADARVSPPCKTRKARHWK